MTTLDHLTKGRAGWNIVTSFGASGAKAPGRREGPRLHDERYDAADEYLEVVYKLWECSWEEGDIRRDKAAGIFAEPNRIRTVRHEGAHFQVEGVFVSEPSPQRAPVLYQAGTSTRGRQFAAHHAECVFISAPSKQTLAAPIADIRRRAAEFGRGPADILVFALLTVIVGRTDEEAWEKLRLSSICQPRGHQRAFLGLERNRLLGLQAGCPGQLHWQRRHTIGNRELHHS